jgi:hypothetical protein
VNCDRYDAITEVFFLFAETNPPWEVYIIASRSCTTEDKEVL